MDIDSFKEAVEGVDEWFVEELKDAGYDENGQELVILEDLSNLEKDMKAFFTKFIFLNFLYSELSKI